MNSTFLLTTHLVVVNLFLLIYLVKTILLFSSTPALDRFTKIIRVPEMIISTLFLVTGIWLYAILGAIKFFQIIKLVLVVVVIPLAIVGFKKKNKMLALLSFVLLVGIYGLAEMSKGKPYLAKNVVMSGNADASQQTGMKTFLANCAMCHGVDGKKKYRDATDLSLSVMNPAVIPPLVNVGSKGKMPAFKNYLSEEEIAAVASYVVTLRGK
ncbi:MAG: cytochrome c [Bacteroidetes bacterium]|nr:cytochrome c [Bacteroidota bacterium]